MFEEVYFVQVLCKFCLILNLICQVVRDLHMFTVPMCNHQEHKGNRLHAAACVDQTAERLRTKHTCWIQSSGHSNVLERKINPINIKR